MRYTKLCPYCGSDRLFHPDIKGEYGWKDTNKLWCRDCNLTFETQKALLINAFIFSVDTYNKSDFDAMEEFAKNYWDKPRSIDAFIPNGTFTVQDGVTKYRIRYTPVEHGKSPPTWRIYRLETLD